MALHQDISPKSTDINLLVALVEELGDHVMIHYLNVCAQCHSSQTSRY